MKTLAFGLAAVIGLALPAIAGPQDQIKIAQATQSGSQSGTTAAQPGSSGGSATQSQSGTQNQSSTRTRNREGSARNDNMKSGSASSERREGREGREGRREGSRTSVSVRGGEREGVRG